MPTTTSTNSAALVMPDPATATNAAVTEEIPDIRGLKDVIDIPTGNEWVLWLFVGQWCWWSPWSPLGLSAAAWPGAAKNSLHHHHHLRMSWRGSGCSVRLA